MNIKFQAGIDVAKFLILATAGATITMLALRCIPLNIIATSLVIGSLVLMVGIMYDIRLAQLKQKEKLQEMVKKHAVDQK